MDSLSVILENCYGIKTFNQTFDFSKTNSNLIYAPNGVMKTSLAKTFLRLSDKKEPEELVFGRPPVFDIKIDGVDIVHDEILVVEPFSSEFKSENISTLLVNKEKKVLYDKTFKDILLAKNKLITELNKVSKVPKEKLEGYITSDLGASNLFDAIRFLKDSDLGNVNYLKLPYLKIFDPKVMELLADDNIKKNIGDYTARYNELIEKSSIFRKHGFNPIKANTVLASLKKEKFFEANHKILLNGKGEEFSSHAELEKILASENEAILGDDSLKVISQKIAKGVASVKYFQELLEICPEISSELNDMDNFKIIIWCSYYLANKELFNDLLSLFDLGKAELESIEEDAQNEWTLWHEAEKKFKERFHLNFSIDVENRTNEILGTNTKAPNIIFTFKNEDNGKDVTFNRGQLDSLEFLSVGERRAMYLLYVIFEFKARQASGKKTLIIIDDIADSFDYKNKYAIIEYLKELSEEGKFGLLVLTHNFDFYRTFQR
jgi:energy-coupling factor transporter ATP-binding protein EcfA2